MAEAPAKDAKKAKPAPPKKPIDPKDAPLVVNFNTSHQLSGARYSPCGKYLVGGGYEGQVHRWDVSGDEPREMPALTTHSGWVSVAFSPQGNALFSGDSWGRLCAWDYTAESPQPRWAHDAAHDGWMRSLAVSPDGKLLATCGRDQHVRLWNTETGKLVRELPDHRQDVFCVLFHPAGKSFVSADLKGIVKQWNIETGQVEREFECKGMYLLSRLQDAGGVHCLAFDRDGKTLACGGTMVKNGGTVLGIPTLLLFDWATGKQTKALKLGEEKDGFVEDVSFAIPGLLLAVTSGTPGNGKLLFNVLTEKEPLASYIKASNVHAVSVHPEGQRLALTGTNPNSSGNGRPKSEEYPHNWSPIHVLKLPPVVLEKLGLKAPEATT